MASGTVPIGGVAAKRPASWSSKRPGAPSVLERKKATPVMEVAFVMVDVLELPDIGGVAVEHLAVVFAVPQRVE